MQFYRENDQLIAVFHRLCLCRSLQGLNNCLPLLLQSYGPIIIIQMDKGNRTVLRVLEDGNLQFPRQTWNLQTDFL